MNKMKIIDGFGEKKDKRNVKETKTESIIVRTRYATIYSNILWRIRQGKCNKQ